MLEKKNALEGPRPPRAGDCFGPASRSPRHGWSARFSVMCSREPPPLCAFTAPSKNWDLLPLLDAGLYTASSGAREEPVSSVVCLFIPAKPADHRRSARRAASWPSGPRLPRHSPQDWSIADDWRQGATGARCQVPTWKTLAAITRAIPPFGVRPRHTSLPSACVVLSESTKSKSGSPESARVGEAKHTRTTRFRFVTWQRNRQRSWAISFKRCNWTTRKCSGRSRRTSPRLKGSSGRSRAAALRRPEPSTRGAALDIPILYIVVLARGRAGVAMRRDRTSAPLRDDSFLTPDTLTQVYPPGFGDNHP